MEFSNCFINFKIEYDITKHFVAADFPFYLNFKPFNVNHTELLQFSLPFP